MHITKYKLAHIDSQIYKLIKYFFFIKYKENNTIIKFKKLLS